MTTTKDALIEILRKMPDDSTAEDVACDLYVRAKNEEGLRQADNGEVISHEEVKVRLARWLA